MILLKLFIYLHLLSFFFPLYFFVVTRTNEPNRCEASATGGEAADERGRDSFGAIGERARITEKTERGGGDDKVLDLREGVICCCEV